ncbi:MAG: ABC transporter permease, partial [Sandaracinaceae bacterium]|nr:ABC transporter permease [Sandaracinaceae bacterium]
MARRDSEPAITERAARALRVAGLLALSAGVTVLVVPAFGPSVPAGLAIAGAVVLFVGIALLVARARLAPSRDGRPWKRFRKNRGALVGAGLLALVAATALFGPYVAPHDPDHIYDGALYEDGRPREACYVGSQAPTHHALGVPLVCGRGGERMLALGSDQLGRDELSRLLFGGRVSLAVALGATTLAAVLGFFVGLLAGYFGGVIDMLSMRGVDFVLSLPFLLVAIALNRVIDDPSLATLCGLLGALSWTTLARVTRAKTLQVRELEYVQAARALGLGHARILLRHVLPNVTAPALVITTTLVAQMIVVESAMSFLGLGVQPPTAS